MPLVLKNEGELVCKAVIDIEDPEGVFSVEPDENVRLLEPDITLDIGERCSFFAFSQRLMGKKRYNYSNFWWCFSTVEANAKISKFLEHFYKLAKVSPLVFQFSKGPALFFFCVKHDVK